MNDAGARVGDSVSGGGGWGRVAAPLCSCWETAGLGLRSNPPPPFVKMGARREDTVLPGTGAQHRVDVIPCKQSGSRQASSRFRTRGPGLRGRG